MCELWLCSLVDSERCCLGVFALNITSTCELALCLYVSPFSVPLFLMLFFTFYFIMNSYQLAQLRHILFASRWSCVFPKFTLLIWKKVSVMDEFLLYVMPLLT